MARPGAIVNALKSIPGGARPTYAPQSSGMGRISPVQAEMYFNNSYANTYGPFLPRPSSWTFTDGAFAPMSPIQLLPRLTRATSWRGVRWSEMVAVSHRVEPSDSPGDRRTEACQL